MLAVARAKARGGGEVTFVTGDAAAPPLPHDAFDVVLCRHVLWALPDPEAAVRAWAKLLKRSGRMVVIEGSWSTGAGLPSEETVALLRRHRFQPTVRVLNDSRFWGGPITDDRYVVTAQLPAAE